MKYHETTITDREVFLDDFRVYGIVEKKFEYANPTISNVNKKIGHFGDGILTLKIRVKSAKILCDVFEDISDSDFGNNIDGE